MLRVFMCSIIILIGLISNSAIAMSESRDGLTIDQGAAGWMGSQGDSKIPPRITVSSEKIGGTCAIRAEAISEGKWQGISVKLTTPVDLTKYGSITFWIKQGYYSSNAACCLMLKSSQGTAKKIYRSFNSGSGEWTKVEVPLDPYSWLQDDKISKASFGIIDTLVWYPYESMHSPKQFIMIAGICFNPKAEELRKIPVAGYRYLVPLKNGDSDCKLLTDEKATKSGQVEWRPFENTPDISFDLGGVYLLNEVKVDAIGIPARNISTIIISVSTDEKEWAPLASIDNQDTSGSEKHQVLKKSNITAVGRYVRVQVNRPRVDVPISLAEVTFVGKLPSEAEMKVAAMSIYRIGPEMPKVSETDYWILKKGTLYLGVHRKTGIINTFSNSGLTVAERIFSRYQMTTKTDTVESDGYSDNILSQRWEGDVLCLKLQNKKLPGLEIEKRLRLVDGRLEEQVKFGNSGLSDPTFLSLSTEVVLNQDYRKDGVYENWGGSASNSLERKFASEIAFNMGASNEAALSFESVARKNCLFHYRYARNNMYTPLGWSVGSMSGTKTTLYTPTGWWMGIGLFKLDKNRKQTVETHLAVVKGTLLKAYDTYLDLPNAKEFYSSIKRPAWLRELRCVTGSSLWDGMWPYNMEMGSRWYSLLLREGYFVSILCGLNFCWGEFPTSGTIRNDFGGASTAEELRDRIARLKASNPRLKALVYTWLWSANKSSQVFQNHPEWFITKDKNGQETVFYPYYGINYGRLASLKESQDDMFNQIHQVVNFYHTDGWYLDGGGAEEIVDRWNLRLGEPEGWYNLHRRLRQKLQEEDPDRFLFFNNVEAPLADIGFLETSSILGNSSWRVGAAWMWKFKLYQHRDPLRNSVYIYWTPEVEGAYEAYIAGLGILPGLLSRDITPRDIPYLSAQYEMRWTKLTDADLTPDWRYDEKTTLEACTLTQGPAGFVFMRSHANADNHQNVSVASAGLGLSDPKKQLYQWAFKVNDARQWTGKLGEPEVEKVYRKTNWRLERIVTPEFLGSTSLHDRCSETFDFSPKQLTMWMMTQSPALVYSVDGLPTQYWLPEMLGVRVTGEIKENQIILDVDSSRKTAEIVTVIPEGYTVREDKNSSIGIFLCGKSRLMVLPVTMGKQRITIDLVKSDIPSGLPDVAISEGKPGAEMALKIKLDKSWIGNTVLAQLEKDGKLYWFKSVTAKSDTLEIKTLVPVAVEGGEYTIHVSDLSGHIVRTAKIILPEGRSEEVLPDRYITLPMEEKIAEVPDSNQGPIQVKRYAWQYSKGSCKASVDPDKKIIFVATSPMIESLWNVSVGGMEIKAKRYLKLRLTGNLSYFQKHGHFYGGHSVYSDQPNYFIGMILDFKGKNGYKVRSVAGLGAVKPERSSGVPEKWGTGKKPVHIYYLSNYANDGSDRQELCIDLKQLGVPEDWDGTLWLSAVLQFVHPDRQMTIEILETADTLPAGAEVTSGKDLLVSINDKKEYNVPSTGKPVTIDGRMVEADWKQAVKISGFAVLNNPGRSMTQETVCYALHDAQNLYLGFEVQEHEKETFFVRSTDKPWENDSLEFCIDKIGVPGELFHVVIDSRGSTFLGLKRINKPEEPINYPGKVAVTKGHGVFYAELSIPLEKLGMVTNPAEQKISFNIMRNRYAPNGETQYGTLVPGNSYFDTKRFYNFKLN